MSYSHALPKYLYFSKDKKIKNKTKINYANKLNHWLLAIFTLLIISYVFLINSLSISSYNIERALRQISKLTSENADLEINLVQLQSPENISRLAKNNLSDQTKSIGAISVPDSKVAIEPLIRP